MTQGNSTVGGMLPRLLAAYCGRAAWQDFGGW